MQCPLKIVKNGNSPQGNYLMVKFDKTSFPNKVRVVVNSIPTNDIDAVNGNSGVWTSRYKYASPAVTLELLDTNDVILNTCTYSISGEPVANKNCKISNSKATYDGSSSVTISWHSDVEVGLKSYIVERINANTLASDRSNMPEPNVRGANNDYRVVDQEIFEDISAYSYNVYANFLDNSTVPIAQSIPVTR